VTFDLDFLAVLVGVIGIVVIVVMAKAAITTQHLPLENRYCRTSTDLSVIGDPVEEAIEVVEASDRWDRLMAFIEEETGAST